MNDEAQALSARGLGKRFGGLQAVRDVSIALERGKVHAVLGPNGAGKSTLINLLSGDLPVSAGSIALRGSDITRLRPEQRSQLGIGRSYQKSNVFASLTAFENCRLAAQSRLPRALRLFEVAAKMTAPCAAAERALEEVGLTASKGALAARLSHGEQRQLELAMVLATGPEVLLLDEPLSGMGAEEADRILALLQKLRPSHAVLLVEHDLDAVFALADRITVMVDGAVLESGPPQQIRESAAVRQAYLGEGSDAAGAASAGEQR